jgi:integrase
LLLSAALGSVAPSVVALELQAFAPCIAKQALRSNLSDIELGHDLLCRAAGKPLHRLTMAHITRAAVAAQLGLIANDNGLVAADRARAALSAFFAWAIREGLAETNPVIGTNKATDPEDTKRDRVLSHNELRTIWRNLGEGHFADIVRLLMLTGQRREEISDLRWSEIDFSKRVISLPASRTKNKRAHDIPLSKTALAILSRQPRMAGREFVFGEGAQGFQGFSKAKAALDARVKLNQPWQLRDLRRTVVTGMGDIEVPPHVVEAIVNHVSGTKGGVAGVYNKSVYAKEKVVALSKWDAELERLT